LGQIKAVHDSGRYLAALDRLNPVVAESRTLAYRALQAEALARTGAVETELGRFLDAEKTLEEALRTAVASHHDDLLPEISANLVWALGFQNRFEESHRWASFAEATIERNPGSNRLVYAWLLNNIGAVHLLEGRYVESLEYQRRSLILKESVLGSDDPDSAGTINNIALGLNGLGRSKEALEQSDLSLRIRRQTLGNAHPQTATTLSNRGEILLALGEAQNALKSYQEADTIWEREFGPQSPAAGYSLTGIGRALIDLARGREAIPFLERALEIRERHDKDDGRLAETEFALARALWQSQKDSSRAMALATKALERSKRVPTATSARTEISTWLAKHRGERTQIEN